MQIIFFCISLYLQSKHVKHLDQLSFQGSIIDVQESIFKKYGYALLGSSKTKLNQLDLSYCLVNDKLVQSMIEAGKLLKRLRALSLSGCRYLTDKSIYLLCDVNYSLTYQLKSLDIFNLPQITQSSLEYLTNKSMKNLSDLNLAHSTQIQSEHLKKAFDTEKFNQLKYLGISSTSESGGQTDIFKFNIPELRTYYIRNHFSEIQLIEILYIYQKYLKDINNCFERFLQNLILIKIVSTDQIILEPETYDLFRKCIGCQRLLQNNQPLQLDNQNKYEYQITSQLINFMKCYSNNNSIQLLIIMKQNSLINVQFLNHQQNLLQKN